MKKTHNEASASRVRFRPLALADVDTLYAIYADEDAMKYRGSKHMDSIEEARLFVERQKLVEGKTTVIRKGVELVSGQTLIGSVMYKYDQAQAGVCEIGCSIGRKYWGQGLGKEALRLMAIELKNEPTLNTIIAWCHHDNIASIKVLESNGFHRTVHTDKASNHLFKMNIG